MTRLVWACEFCWSRLLQEGARLQGAASVDVDYCECCRAHIRPGRRVMRFLLPR